MKKTIGEYEISGEVRFLFTCPHCSKEHSDLIDIYYAGKSEAWETSTLSGQCDCGAEFNIDLEAEASASGWFGPKPEAGEEVVLPGPNQIDMFTGKTLADEA
jgi:hypothetical protein